ncbi:MAG: hypothetical protein OEM52_09660 [bacterium]|nr:hypothetical protein [bacterium]
MHITTRALFFRDGRNIIALSPELGISSWGNSVDDASRNLQEAVRLYCETARDQNDLVEVLEDAGYSREAPGMPWVPPPLLEQRDVDVEFDEQ